MFLLPKVYIFFHLRAELMKANSYSIALISQHHQCKMECIQTFSLQPLKADLRAYCSLISPVCVCMHTSISKVGVHDHNVLKT